MNKPHLLGQFSIRLKAFTAIGILYLALAGTAWGQTLANSGQQEQPAPPESAERLAAPAAKNPTVDGYVIGNSDLLDIDAWKEPGLTESVPVRSDGKISMPLIGEIQASSRAPNTAQRKDRRETAQLRKRPW